MKKIIYLTRHTDQYKDFSYINSNDNSQIQNEKIILSIKGEEEAKNISLLKELQNIGKVYSSNYVRAIETAKYVAINNKLKINIDSDLGERKLGDLDELKKLGKLKNLTFTLEQILNKNLKNLNGESRMEVTKRISNSINNILKEPFNNFFVVSHGAAIKFYLMQFCEVKENKFWFKNKIIDIYYPNIIKLELENSQIVNISNIKIK